MSVVVAARRGAATTFYSGTRGQRSAFNGKNPENKNTPETTDQKHKEGTGRNQEACCFAGGNDRQTGSHDTENTAELPAEPQTTILIVDDDEGVRDFLTHICTMQGFRVRAASRDRDALDIIEQDPPDLMFLDIHMKGGSGVELARILKRRSLNVPTIVISGALSLKITEQVLGLGIERIVAKPFDAQRVLCEIQDLLPQADDRRQANV